MDDAVPVRIRQCIQNLHGNLCDTYGIRDASAVYMLVKGCSLDIFEDKIGVAILLAHIENRHDVSMAQRTDRSRLFQQRRIALRIRLAEMQRLDSHFALQLRIPCQIYDTLATPPQLMPDFKSADFLCHVNDSSVNF